MEAGRWAMTRNVQRGRKIWVRIILDKSDTIRNFTLFPIYMKSTNFLIICNSSLFDEIKSTRFIFTEVAFEIDIGQL